MGSIESYTTISSEEDDAVMNISSPPDRSTVKTRQITRNGLDIICFKCGRYGHTRDTCFDVVRLMKKSNQGNVCFKCGRLKNCSCLIEKRYLTKKHVIEMYIGTSD